MRNVYSSASGRQGYFGRLFTIIFLLAFGLLGTFFFWTILSDLLVTIDTLRWPTERCEILESRIRTPPSHASSFEPFIRYRYHVHGLPQTSTSISKHSQKVSDVGNAQRFIDRFPVGTKVSCFVNPNNAADAILVHGSLLQGFALFLPLVFVLIGFGGAYAACTASSLTLERKQAPRMISKGTELNLGGRLIVTGFFGAFFLVGFIFMVQMTNELWRGLQSTGWPRQSCRVISSDVKEHHSSDSGSTYSVNVLYEYEARGRTLRSNLYTPFNVSSGSYSTNKRIADSYEPGSFVDCYVDPSDPTYAVLEPGIGWSALLVLIPCLFMGVALGGIILGLRIDVPSSNRQNRVQSRRSVPRPHHRGPIELKPKSSPIGRFAAVIFMALFWNGIVSVFVWDVIQSLRNGRVEIFRPLFLIPFVLVGLALTAWVIYSFLGLFLPRPKLLISTDIIPLGSSATVSWRIKGSTARIRTLSLSLIGYEQVRYTRGTSTNTDKREFYRDDFLNTPLQGQRQGSASFTIPADTMHTFRASNNKILWKITLEGDIPLSPSLKEEYEIEVTPVPRREG